MTHLSEPLIIREQDGEIDEVIARNATVHFERMDNVAWWIGITLPDGSEVHVNVGAVNQRAKPYATYWVEMASPVCPECRDGKCRNCTDEALNDEDELVPCGCPDHVDGGL